MTTALAELLSKLSAAPAWLVRRLTCWLFGHDEQVQKSTCSYFWNSRCQRCGQGFARKAPLGNAPHYTREELEALKP